MYRGGWFLLPSVATCQHRLLMDNWLWNLYRRSNFPAATSVAVPVLPSIPALSWYYHLIMRLCPHSIYNRTLRISIFIHRIQQHLKLGRSTLKIGNFLLKPSYIKIYGNFVLMAFNKRHISSLLGSLNCISVEPTRSADSSLESCLVEVWVLPSWEAILW